MIWTFVTYLGAGIWLALLIALVSFAIGAVLGVPLLLMRRSPSLFLRGVARAFVDLIRGIPPIVWLFIIYFGLAQDVVTIRPLPAVLIGFSLIATAYMSEIYRGALVGVDPGQWEAGQAVGLSRSDILRWVIGPQAVRIAIPPASTFFIALLKESSLASTLGVAEITHRATVQTAATYQGLTVFVVAAGWYLLLSVPFAALSRWLYKRLGGK